MAGTARTWTCRRKFQGKQCLTTNPSRKRTCQVCGKPKPPKRQTAHRAVLAMPYEWWTDRFGTVCNICGRAPSAGRRLDRDHDHKTGEARGLLCHRCNRGLDWFDGAAELFIASQYVMRAKDLA